MARSCRSTSTNRCWRWRCSKRQPLLRDGDTRGNFRSEDFKRALRFYREMFDHGFAPATSATIRFPMYGTSSRAGYFTFYITGPWSIGEFKRRLPANLQASWMTAPLPGPKGPSYSIAGGSSLVVFKDSPRKKAAWQLVQYLSQRDVQLRFYALTGNLPPRRSAWSDEASPARHLRAGLSRAARARQACFKSARVGAHCH